MQVKTQGNLFGESEIDHLKGFGFSEADKTWLKRLDDEEKKAGIAFLQWKKTNFKTWDKTSRPQLWMEGFLLGVDVGAAEKEQA